MMWSKKLTSRSGQRVERYRAIGAASVLALAAFVTGCGKPRAEKPAPPPQRAFVSLQTLAEAHPLANSLRELDASAERLRRDNAARPIAQAERITFAPVREQTVNPADNRRNNAARTSLQQNAEITLARYIRALRNTNQRVQEEKRAELEGIARARSAESEAQARAEIENQTRLAIAGRSDDARDARIRRNAARLNLGNNNIISVARDPETNLPSEKVLEAQIQELREREERNPSRDPGDNFVTSDEARMTKLLRDLEAQLREIRTANERDTLFNNDMIADAIATIRSNNAVWVEEQLAKMPNRDQSQTQLTSLRRELTALLLNLQQTERFTRLSGTLISGQSENGFVDMPPIASSPAVTNDLFGRLDAERAAIRAAISSDLLAAVRDAGLAHNVEPIFSKTSNLPNRTGDFHRWIFGNVDAVTLSNQSAQE